MAVTVAEMLKMSQAQLDDLFTQSPAGEIPSGQAKGTAIVAPGTTYTQNIADFINHFAWQGKISIRPKVFCATKFCHSGSTRSSRRSIKARAGWTIKNASCWTIRTLRCWRIGFAMKSAKSRRAFISEKFIGAKNG